MPKSIFTKQSHSRSRTPTVNIGSPRRAAMKSAQQNRNQKPPERRLQAELPAPRHRNTKQSQFLVSILRHSSAVRSLMQGCIVTSRFPPNWGESRGAPVVKRRSDGPSRDTLPRTGSLLLLSARAKGFQEAVRLRSGEQKNLFHRTMIGRPTKYSSGNPKALDYLLLQA
jgi:hypothetical protein